jgi:hypothetical protein
MDDVTHDRNDIYDILTGEKKLNMDTNTFKLEKNSMLISGLVALRIMVSLFNLGPLIRV